MRFHSRISCLRALPTTWCGDCMKNRRMKNRRMKNRRMKNRRMRRKRPLFIHDGAERPICRPSDKVDREVYYSGKKKRHTLKNVLLVDSFGSIHFLSGTMKEGCMINASQMKRDTPFQQGVCSIKTPDFKDLACLVCRSCSQRRSRAMERSHRGKRRKTGVSHPFASVSTMVSAISSGIGLFTTSSVSVDFIKV